jgi:hypothetical protein
VVMDGWVEGGAMWPRPLTVRRRVRLAAGLVGPLPPQLALLAHVLQRLSLDDNALSGKHAFRHHT